MSSPRGHGPALQPALLLLVVGAAVFTGCAGDNTDRPQRTPAAKPELKPLTLKVGLSASRVTTRAVAAVRGRVTPGARVTVGKKNARVRGEHFHARVHLKVGVNRIAVVARRSGYRTARERITIKRRKPPPVAAPTAVPSPGGCPSGQYNYMGRGCVPNDCPGAGCAHPPTPPARPEDCPPGQVPVGQTGACAPPEQGAPPGDQGSQPQGCDPNYIFPDGTNGCTHNYGD